MAGAMIPEQKRVLPNMHKLIFVMYAPEFPIQKMEYVVSSSSMASKNAIDAGKSGVRCKYERQIRVAVAGCSNFDVNI